MARECELNPFEMSNLSVQEQLCARISVQVCQCLPPVEAVAQLPIRASSNPQHHGSKPTCLSGLCEKSGVLERATYVSKGIGYHTLSCCSWLTPPGLCDGIQPCAARHPALRTFWFRGSERADSLLNIGTFLFDTITITLNYDCLEQTHHNSLHEFSCSGSGSNPSRTAI
jgi:hypothetical protein